MEKKTKKELSKKQRKCCSGGGIGQCLKPIIVGQSEQERLAQTMEYAKNLLDSLKDLKKSLATRNSK